MPEIKPEPEPVDATAAYQDPRSVPLSEAWKLLDPATAPQDRLEAVKSHLHDATLVLLALPHPPRPGDRALRLSSELVRRALDHPTVDLLLASDELITGASRRGGLAFILCRAIRSEHVASAQPVPENEPVGLVEGLARFAVMIETLPQNIKKFKAKARAEFGPELPPVSRDALLKTLTDLFVDEPALEKAGAERLSELIPDLDPRFQHQHGQKKHGRWKKKVLKHRIREVIVEARDLAAERRSDDG